MFVWKAERWKRLDQQLEGWLALEKIRLEDRFRSERWSDQIKDPDHRAFQRKFEIMMEEMRQVSEELALNQIKQRWAKRDLADYIKRERKLGGRFYDQDKKDPEYFNLRDLVRRTWIQRLKMQDEVVLVLHLRAMDTLVSEMQEAFPKKIPDDRVRDLEFEIRATEDLLAWAKRQEIMLWLTLGIRQMDSSAATIRSRMKEARRRAAECPKSRL